MSDDHAAHAIRRVLPGHGHHHNPVMLQADGRVIERGGYVMDLDPVEWELFDLVADPLEVDNVWDDPDHRDIRAELLDELLRRQAAVGDRPFAAAHG